MSRNVKQLYITYTHYTTDGVMLLQAINHFIEPRQTHRLLRYCYVYSMAMVYCFTMTTVMLLNGIRVAYTQATTTTQLI